MNRRNLLKTGLTIAGASLLASKTSASTLISGTAASNASPGRRKLGGKLEVSSIGIGVQNHWRTY